FPPPSGFVSLSETSDGNIVTAGVLVSRVDMIPEPDPVDPTQMLASKQQWYPANSTLKSQYGSRTKLLQGDGLTASNFAPVPVFRLDMALQPSGLVGVVANINSIKLRNIGTLPDSDIFQMNLYSDKIGAGNLGSFDPEDFIGGSPVD